MRQGRCLSRGRDSQALSAPHPPAQPLASPWHREAPCGGCAGHSITPAGPGSPDRNNAPFCPGGDRGHCVCRLRPETQAQLPLRKEGLSWATSRAWGCHQTRHNKLRAGEGTATLKDRVSLRLQAWRPQRNLGRDRKQELWGRLD